LNLSTEWKRREKRERKTNNEKLREKERKERN